MKDNNKWEENQKAINLAYCACGLMTWKEMIEENEKLKFVDTNTEFGDVSIEDEKGEEVL